MTKNKTKQGWLKSFLFVFLPKILQEFYIHKRSYIDKNINFLHDYKSTLQELVQTTKKSVNYEIVSETGPAHNKHFVCEAIVSGVVLGHGEGSSKKAAEQMAAKDALAKQAK